MKKRLLQHLLMLTKFTLYGFFIQCILCSTLFATDGKAQIPSVKDVIINLDVKEERIDKVLELIESETQFSFVYTSKELNPAKKVTLQAQKAPLSDVLVELSRQAGIKFRQVNQNISIQRMDRREEKNSEEYIKAAFAFKVNGRVTDATTGEGLPGVSVRVKDTAIGMNTNLEGEFSIDAPDENSILVFSFVGFVTQEVPINGRSKIEVVMEEDQKVLEEVVVTDFGNVVRKTDMIGAVQGVNPSELKIPSSNLTTALAGRVAGMIAFQRSGEPGMDNADFFIRGITTFGGNIAPLILIDNVEVTKTDLARLQVDDIESFSIMKDATATAVYGARGANGVILVTTKKGVEGPTTMDIRIENSISAPTKTVELADPVTYMILDNEARLTRDPGAAIFYSQRKIERTAAGDDPMLYPAVDWMNELMRPYAINQRVHVNVRGGGKKARFFVSGAFNQDNGVLKVPQVSNFNNNINLKTYSLRSNVTMDLTKSTELLVRLNGSFDDYNGPLYGGSEVYAQIMRSNPVLFQPFYPKGEEQKYVRHIMFGNAGEGGYLNPYAEMVRGYKESSRSMMLAQLELRQDLSFITPGLKYRMLGNTTRRAFFDISRAYSPFYYSMSGIDPVTGEYRYLQLNENSGTDYLGYSEGDKVVETLFYMENALNYSRTVNEKHNLSGMLVYIMRNSLLANAGSLQQSLPFRNLGLSGRSTYNYDSRYYVEFNFGYNGSERFHTDHRWGFFPSAGLAWSVSNEDFWNSIKPVVSKLRVRGTYGLVGNDAIGSSSDRFLYLSEINMNDNRRGAVFGTDRMYSRPGISLLRYSNPGIGWEKAYKGNLAVELGLFDKIEMITDFFQERRTDIFMYRADIPTTMGLAAPIAANIGEAMGRGVDIQLNGQHSFNSKTWMQMMGNFTYATSEFLVYEEPNYPHPWLSREGHNLSQQWGYIAERLFVDDAEVANSPEQVFGSQPVRGGDIKYYDTNGDGRISSLDRVPIGFPTTPEINYGAGLSMGHGNFDVSFFLQGSARSSFWIDPYATAPFVGDRQLLKAYADDHYSEEERNIYALWPRLSPIIVDNNVQRNTWFMRDGSFLRLKQAEIGYNLPRTALDKFKMRNLRIYVNGTNLLTFSGFKLWDVEMAGNGLGYPVQRVFNLGINASF